MIEKQDIQALLEMRLDKANGHSFIFLKSEREIAVYGMALQDAWKDVKELNDAKRVKTE